MTNKFHRRPGNWLDELAARRRSAETSKTDERCPRVLEPELLRCPFCESTDLKITRTLQTRPVQRYRLCRACGKTFLSLARS